MKVIITSIITTLLLIFVVYNFLPLSWLDLISIKSKELGATITAIQGSDKLSDSRSVINTNFTNLNENKIEMSTTSVKSITTLESLTSAATLASIGTIATGVWNATEIAVAKHGTGTTSPESNQVMIGDGSNGLKVIGFGTNGQFLTSGGDATVPSWTTGTVDQSQAYTWTGVNNFTNTLTMIKGLNASSTVANPLILNEVSYSLPSTQGAASTTLMNNGSGVLTWLGFSKKLTVLPSASLNCSTNNAASTTVYSILVPADTLGESNVVRVRTNMIDGNYSAGNVIWFDASYGTASTTSTVTAIASAFGINGFIEVNVVANGATNAQIMTMSITGSDAGRAKTATLTQDSTNDLYITLVTRSVTNGPLTCGNTIVEIIQ